MTDLTDRLKGLMEKATRPVWIVEGVEIFHADGPQAWIKHEIANVALIVEAVNALPELIAQIEADAARIEVLKAFAIYVAETCDDDHYRRKACDALAPPKGPDHEAS